MFILSLAFKNLFRSVRRLVLSTFAIVIGTIYLILGQSLIGGIEESIIRSALDGLTGHAQIRVADYPEQGMQHPVDDLVELSPEARAYVEEHSVAVTERTMFAATAVSGSDSMRIRGVVYDPGTDEAVFSRAVWKTEPPDFVPTSEADGAMVGAGLAKLLELNVGDTLVLQARTPAGAINALGVPVGCILNTSNMAIDGSTVFLPKEIGLDLLRTEVPSHVVVKTKKRDDVTAFSAGVAPLLGEAYEVTTWIEETRELIRIQGIRRRALNILVGVLLLMSGFAIANTILMAAYERVREIGTLRAMGMGKGSVLVLFLAEGGMMGSVAGALGAAIGGYGAWYLSHNPIDMMAAGQNDMLGASIQFSSWLYGQFSLGMVLAPFLVALGVSIVASLYPARLASQMEPADAVKAEG
jgi:putative ABC transport system permease protein